MTFAVVGWVDVFTRKDYCDIIISSLRHCQMNKGLRIHAWCLMSNHIHLVISTSKSNTSEILRDFKKYTGKKIIQAIENHAGESRKEWMLKIFSDKGSENARNVKFQF